MDRKQFLEELKKLGFPVFEKSRCQLANRNQESVDTTTRLLEEPAAPAPEMKEAGCSPAGRAGPGGGSTVRPVDKRERTQ